MSAPGTGGMPNLPINIPKISSKSQALNWGCGCAVLFIGAFFLLLFLLFLGGSVGTGGMLVGMIIGTLPVPIYLTVIWWLDRFEQEPPWLLGITFVWGSCIATLMSLVLNMTGSKVLVMVFGVQLGNKLTAPICAPLFEESTKALILFILFFWKKDEFDGVLDGIVYASVSALGFAMVENFLYYGRAFAGGGVGGSIGLFVMRGIAFPFSHPLFTSMTGIGLGIAATNRNPIIKIAAPILGLMMAMFLHFLWNGSATFLGESLGAGVLLLLLMMVLSGGVFMLGIVIFSLKQESVILRTNLQPEVASGLITPADLDTLGNVFKRLTMGLGAFKGGMGRVGAQSKFFQVATELAFMRNRNSKRNVPPETAAQEEETYRQTLAQLKAQLG